MCIDNVVGEVANSTNSNVSTSASFNNSLSADMSFDNRKSLAAQDRQQEADGDGLRIRRIAGGCMINHEPVFSPDGDTLYVVWDNIVRAFSVATGECIRDYDGEGFEIVGLIIDRFNPKLLYACTRTGELLSWKANSGVLNNREVIMDNIKVNHFSILYKEQNESSFLVVGDKMNVPTIMIYCPTKRTITATHFLRSDTPIPKPIKFAPGAEGLNFFAFITGHLWNYGEIRHKHIKITTKKHCNSVTATVISCHPTEDIVAVGDSIGRVVLYKHFLRQRSAVPETYHWHANPVQCVTFSHTGTHFYSGGLERCLIKWTVGKQDTKDILPRLSDSIQQIAVAPENLRVALCTADNGIQILNALQKQIAVVQSFSRISDDHTGRNAFPVGLRVNPRTQALILNGRVGCVQFFSTYSRSLLYTLDITLRNYNTVEQRQVIYNTVVTNVAVNAHWLATVETWNDNCYSSETRLKFWRYDDSRQNYELSTNVENVHQDGVNGLEFSNGLKERDLVCASAGKDRCVKIWSLEEIEVTGGGEKLVWICVGRVDYKGLPVESISFSQDGSLLAGGFGNVLCAWNAETLKLKCVLSAPGGNDGGVNRVVLSIPEKNNNINKQQYLEKRSKVVQQLLEILKQKDASSLVKHVQPCKKIRHLDDNIQSVKELSTDDRKSLFGKAKFANELTLLQKTELFHHLKIQCRTSNQMKEKIAEKLANAKKSSTAAGRRLQETVDKLCSDVRFRSRRKLRNYQYKKTSSVMLRSLTKIFGVADKSHRRKSRSAPKKKGITDAMKPLAKINHVLFCHGEHSHLVVMTTEKRLLVWNLLTLRIQVTVNISVKRITIDSFTNLIAAFTVDNELYIFLPNIPMPLYHRRNLPVVYGAAWIPRRYPKSQSLNIDWQAVSQLYFLNENQELLHLVSDSDEESLGPVVYMNEMLGNGLPNTPFAAMLTKQVSTGAAVSTAGSFANGLGAGPMGVAGKGTIKEIVSSSAHTMAPISLLCKDFLQSLLLVQDRRHQQRQPLESDESTNNATTNPDSPKPKTDKENDSDDEMNGVCLTQQINLENQLMKIMDQPVDIEF
ncbi:WD repeat-containing protein 75-like [Uranotaenia lowii]|uniref:WD repeat-containing protein 75-like n=1 Tax=Uranotaenia lowii TaxID=190385 RepID=UPI00247B0F00|nr:WD repeat-containing protein 75-like [Uranotaenia lowii]